jgi:hypothetical protein
MSISSGYNHIILISFPFREKGRWRHFGCRTIQLQTNWSRVITKVVRPLRVTGSVKNWRNLLPGSQGFYDTSVWNMSHVITISQSHPHNYTIVHQLHSIIIRNFCKKIIISIKASLSNYEKGAMITRNDNFKIIFLMLLYITVLCSWFIDLF